MKNFRLKQLLVAVVALLCSVVANAHDFEVDGICYNITSSSGLKVEVTYKGISSYYNEYSGAVEIPERVTYKGKTYSVTSIGEKAFYNCEVLKSVTIPNSVTSIGDWAFSSCTGLKSITIPNSVTSIGDYAFGWCDGLTSITIPNSVTSIGESAFYGCDGLTSINIPNSVTSIGGSAFSYCDGLTSVTIGNSVTSIGYCAFSDCSGLTSIVVNSGNTKYDSRNNCNAIIETSTNTLVQGFKNTKIPNSVTSIGDWAFSGCSGLTSITIPNSVTSIGENAFYSCDSLTSITIPNSVTSIGGSAFSYCYGLTSINIPNSVTSIGSSAFSDCSGLTSVVVESGNSVYDSRDNCNAIIETATNTIITGCKNTVIPESVTSIGRGAFYGCYGLTSINIPNSVTSIGSSAFGYCDGLTSITIPNSVTSIGEYAFCDCGGLKSVTIPNSVTSIGDWAFSRCSGLTNVTIGSGVTSIGSSAFSDCKGLKTVINFSNLKLTKNSLDFGNIYHDVNLINISDGYTLVDNFIFTDVDGVNTLCGYIGNDTEIVLPDNYKGENYIIRNDVFNDCIDLTSVTVGSGVTSIGSSAFSGCSSLKSIVVKSGNTKYDSRNNCNAIIETATNTLIAGCKNTKIPNSVTNIGSDAFHGCSSLTSVTIPNSVTSIGKSAFFGCSGLTSIDIPNSVTSIGGLAFSYCTGLKNVAIGNGVKKIESQAFYNCDSLENVYITDLTAWCNIEHGSWSNPLNYAKNFYLNKELLTDIVIPQDVTEIKREAFVGYYNLKSVTIGDNVTSYIGDLAFQNCVNLKSIKIGKNITGINNAFFRCTGITNIEVKSGNTKYDSRDNCNAIIETATNKLIMGCKNTIIPSSVISIGGSAFSDCKVLTSIVIPNSVTSIGGSAFSGCTGLKNVTIGKGVKKMEKWAFYNCDSLENVYIADLSAWCNIEHGSLSNPLDYAKNFYLNEKLLTDVVIPQDVTKLKDEVFIGYYNLKNVSIGDNISLIGGRAFQNCVNLNSVKIGKNVTSIGENAFNGCEKLISVYLLSETPKKIMNDNSFSNYDATLYVPKGALDAYRAAEGWKKFTKIIEYNPTDIEDIAEDAPVFKVTAGGVSLSNAEGEAVAVYTTGGALVEKIDCYAGGNIALGKGVYIISVGGKAVKIKL